LQRRYIQCSHSEFQVSARFEEKKREKKREKNGRAIIWRNEKSAALYDSNTALGYFINRSTLMVSLSFPAGASIPGGSRRGSVGHLEARDSERKGDSRAILRNTLARISSTDVAVVSIEREKEREGCGGAGGRGGRDNGERRTPPKNRREKNPRQEATAAAAATTTRRRSWWRRRAEQSRRIS
jgi:hypothetical protein